MIIFDTKRSCAVLNIKFYSKIIRLQMNHSFLMAASKDHIFLFQLRDMQRIASIKAPNHLLRMALAPNCISEQVGQSPYLVYSDSVLSGKVSLFNTQKD